MTESNDEDFYVKAFLTFFGTLAFFAALFFFLMATDYSGNPSDDPYNQDYLENTCGGPAVTC